MKKGILYGVSTGPGESGLLTVEALKVMNCCDTIMYPVKKAGEHSVARNIVSNILNLSSKNVIELLFTMDTDNKTWSACHSDAADTVCERLAKGEDIAVVTLGDATVFSTYMYLDAEVRRRGYMTRVVPGVTSFCHGAAKAGIPLTVGDESLAIIPFAKNDSERLSKALDLFENIVVMKAFRSIDKIASVLDSKGIDRSKAVVLCNIGMKNEYVGPLDTKREYDYFTTIIIKRGA